MGPYVWRRIAQAVPLLFAIVIVDFLIIHLAPGDPVYALVGDFPAPQAYVQQVRAEFGLDRPIGTQLWLYVRQIAAGNFGYSFAQRRPVRDVILGRMGATLLLMATAWSVAGVLGVTLGVLSSLRPHSASDGIITVGSLLGFSIPEFWLAQVCVLAFAVLLGWFPAQGMSSVREEFTGVRHAADVGWHLVLPALALSARFLAINARLTRASMLGVLGQDFIVTARAKGLSGRRVTVRHALRNALLPVTTVMGVNLGFLVGGSVLVETVFAWPGIGRLLYDSLANRDYPVILGAFVLIAAAVVVANLLTDLAYGFLDPRVRY